jgi:hypothetical protein
VFINAFFLPKHSNPENQLLKRALFGTRPADERATWNNGQSLSSRAKPHQSKEKSIE